MPPLRRSLGSIWRPLERTRVGEKRSFAATILIPPRRQDAENRDSRETGFAATLNLSFAATLNPSFAATQNLVGRSFPARGRGEAGNSNSLGSSAGSP